MNALSAIRAEADALPVVSRFYIARVTDNGETFTRQGVLTFTDATVACDVAKLMNRDRDEIDYAEAAEYVAVTEMVS